MQQRQLRLGDILDDYCPRERRLTNHAVVAMVGADVKQTRCTTCDAEHEYKHARVPRQRRKSESPAALYAHPAPAPKRVPHDEPAVSDAPLEAIDATPEIAASAVADVADPVVAMAVPVDQDEAEADEAEDDREEGPVHRPLIRASLPRPEGQPPPARSVPDFTIRQPGGRHNRFRPRHQHGAPFQGNRSNGNMGGPLRGRPPLGQPARRNRPGRKRSK